MPNAVFFRVLVACAFTACIEFFCRVAWVISSNGRAMAKTRTAGSMKMTRTYDLLHRRVLISLCRNAPQLIQEFWQNNTKKRKSMDKALLKKSEAESSKKRGRKSQVDDDNETKAAKRRKSQPPKDEEAAEDEPTKDMSAYVNKSSWEDLVDIIDTVENDNKNLWVYLSLSVSPLFFLLLRAKFV